MSQAITLEGPLNCLSSNRECSRIVTAGRNVFKVFNIDDNNFVETCNLRVGRNLNLNYCAADVAWSPIQDSLLASAATNGAVVTWNLEKNSKSKLDQVYHVHTMSVNRVTFHPSESSILFSGSQDGFIKMFDLRKPDTEAQAFNGQAESVRDVQFCPLDSVRFAAAFESGQIQIWDMRYNTKCERQFTAHNGPVLSIDWHWEKQWLASAGRDASIKVWDLPNIHRQKTVSTIQTMAPVARLKWRPQLPNHIASCALILDFSINVWDIQRPFIPLACFGEHRDVVTGIVWHPRDNNLFSSGRDGIVYHHAFRDAMRPADSANPVAACISANGSVIQATYDKLTSFGKSGVGAQTRFPSHFKSTIDKTEQSSVVSSLLTEFCPNTQEANLSMEWFVQSAIRYKLSGTSLENLCQHNANVALELNRWQVSETWKLIQLLYCMIPGSKDTVASMHSNSSNDKLTTMESILSHQNTKEDFISSSSMNRINAVDEQTHDLANSSSLNHVVNGDSDEIPLHLHTSQFTTDYGQYDIFFSDSDSKQNLFDYETYGLTSNMQPAWNLPSEAFALRQDIDVRPPTPSLLAANNDSNTSDVEASSHKLVMERVIKQELFSAVPFLSRLPPWDFSELVVSTLHHFADSGDIQMCVTMLVVLGDRISNRIDETLREQWLLAYIDLLGHFRLWCVATEIVRLAGIASVATMNHESTMMRIHCSKCNKIFAEKRPACICDRCSGALNTCVVCHLPVKGLYVWCQGCSHGGHLPHVKEWFSKRQLCPAGCGHRCEYK